MRGLFAAVALVLLCAPLLLDAVPINFSGTVSQNGITFMVDRNVTVHNNGDYSRRRAFITTLPNLAVMYSERVALSTTEAHGSYCMGFISSVPFTPPVVAQTIADVKASWVGQLLPVFDFDGAAAAVFTLYESLQEISPSGAVVRSHNLANLNLKFPLFNAVKTSTVVTAEGEATLKYFTLNTTSSSVPISLTFVIPEVLGVLNIGGATATPKAIETIVEVLGYELTSPLNHLRLNMVTAAASLSATGTAEITTNALVQGSGYNAAYFRGSQEVIVDGQATTVRVTTASSDEAEVTGTVSWIAEALVGSADFVGKVSVARVSVDLPDGAQTFTYDASTGFDPTNSAARVIPMIAFVVAAIAAAFNL